VLRGISSDTTKLQISQCENSKVRIIILLQVGQNSTNKVWDLKQRKHPLLLTHELNVWFDRILDLKILRKKIYRNAHGILALTRHGGNGVQMWKAADNMRKKSNLGQPIRGILQIGDLAMALKQLKRPTKIMLHSVSCLLRGA
jgi:hypothetical protein